MKVNVKKAQKIIQDDFEVTCGILFYALSKLSLMHINMAEDCDNKVERQCYLEIAKRFSFMVEEISKIDDLLTGDSLNDPTTLN